MVKKIKIKRKKKKRKKKHDFSNPVFCKRLLKAITDSGGVTAVMAHKLGVSYYVMYTIIKKAPQWVLEAIEREKELIGDIAEVTVREMMQQRLDFGTAGRIAMQVLKSKKHRKRGYGEDKNLTLQGGKKPIKVQAENLVSVKQLKTIPIELRKKMLTEMEEGDSDE